MKICPYCGIEICIRRLPHPGFFKNYRICPNCQEKFTVDIDTKYRQAFCLCIVLVSLVFTLLLYMKNFEWLLPALVSYAVFGLVLYWGNKKLFYVPYKKDGSKPQSEKS